jgi:perosamine synthetase
MSHSKIPLLKVFMADSVKDAVVRVLYSGYIGEGEEVAAFERELSEHFGGAHVLTMNSGTSALHLAYHMALDGSGDAEIITTPMTCAATNMPILHNRARIVWADVDPLSGNIDPDAIEKLITDRTRAIMMVHWGGNPCDIGRIVEIGRRQGIKVMEDAAHALGATYDGLPVGRHSDFVIFSFQAVKHITSVDGGCLVCNDAAVHDRGRLLRWYGVDRNIREAGDGRCEIDAPEAGYKFHMNNVAAAIGRENFKHLSPILERQRDNARFYNSAFCGSNAITVAPENPRGSSSYWLYALHVGNRDEVMRKLLEQGIEASKVHGPNDSLSAFKASRRHLPNCESFANTHLCIPVGWWVSPPDRERIAESVIKFAR